MVGVIRGQPVPSGVRDLEFLDPLVARVHHVKIALAIDRHPVGFGELAGAVASDPSPNKNSPSVVKTWTRSFRLLTQTRSFPCTKRPIGPNVCLENPVVKAPNPPGWPPLSP